MRTRTIDVAFSGLVGTTKTAHIHGPTATPFSGNAGVITTTPTCPGFPLGVTSGVYSATFDTLDGATCNLAFVTAQGSVAASEASLFEGRSYLNIHTAFAGGGEIRGFLARVPLPAGFFLSLSALVALGALRARHRTASRWGGAWDLASVSASLEATDGQSRIPAAPALCPCRRACRPAANPVLV
jgi:hypothetical protein